MITYKAKILESISNGPGKSNNLRVGVFQDQNGVESIIGQYVRNHFDLYNTFCHFRHNGRDYALYSPDYTATRLMELPTCKDLGGETPSPEGFCPVDYYVPYYIDREAKISDPQLRETLKKDRLRYRVQHPRPEDLIPQREKSTRFINDTETIEGYHDTYPVSDIIYYPFGFVAGCLWGDDSTWKLQYLELSNVANGILSRQERFGYLHLSRDKSLADAVAILDNGEPGNLTIEVSSLRYFGLDDGKEITNAI